MKFLLGLVTGLYTVSTLACPVSLDTFKVKARYADTYDVTNDVYLDEGSAIVTEKDFKWAISRVLKIYNPYFKNRGRDFKIMASWRDSELNAYASREHNTSLLYLSGGYARAPYMSKDAYFTVICHEIGHHLGGYPQKMGSWASSEGQADYYSTLKCMKNLLKFDPMNKKIAMGLKLAPEVKAQCRAQYKTQDDYYVCLRSVKAAEDYGRMNSYMMTRRDPTQLVSLMHVDTTVVPYTIESHPAAQCRLDTKYQGALCNVDEKIVMGENNEITGSCHQSHGHTIGLRPACWFASQY